MSWSVIYTKPNFEIKVANALNNIGINSYCPTFTQIVQYSDRKKKVERPLLPSYVLVKVNEKNRNRVFSINGVLRYLFWLGKPAIVRESEIEIIQKNISGVYDEISIKKLTIGSKLNITQGPFKGQVGNIVRLSNKNIRLELSSLGLIVILKSV